jgi:hypothetical protein
LLWAIKVARSEDYPDIVVEGDAKICFRDLNGDKNCCNRKINLLGSNSKLLGSSFIYCNFRWVRRDVNTITHSLVKFTSLQNRVLITLLSKTMF